MDNTNNILRCRLLLFLGHRDNCEVHDILYHKCIHRPFSFLLGVFTACYLTYYTMFSGFVKHFLLTNQTGHF